MSISEELQSENRPYPNNQRAFKVPANAYASALTQHIRSQFSKRVTHFSENDQFEEIVALTHAVAKTIDPDSASLSLPLKRVLYSCDESLQLPVSEDFSLASSSLITNDKTAKNNFFKNLKFELQTADSFTFMVSFIRRSGLQLLLNPLDTFRERGKNGRILTSVYMNVTEPSALRKLLGLPHVETRVYVTTQESFHTKAYLFERANHHNSSALIGSSNISQAALVNGEEWNVKVPRSNTTEVYDQAHERFERLWSSEQAIPLSETFIDEYEAYLDNRPASEVKIKKTFDYLKKSHQQESSTEQQAISPNSMQQEALNNLTATRARGEDRAVAIAATGTGKTYLAAFDACQFEAKRVLFLAHRDELLESAIETFSKVFQDGTLCGKLTGKRKETDKRFIFSTVQTLSRENHLHAFAPTDFDYIVVDEFHHAEASTYRRILDYFTPEFLFGMTATPERMDGRDVLKLCNYNIVCDIRLKDALAMNLLAPFHYFGVADETVDYEKIEKKNGAFIEKKLVEKLNTVERVNYVIEQMEKYGFHGQLRCALGFCVNREHAHFMNQCFNERGIISTVLTGQSAPEERQLQIKNLQNPDHPLEVIFTVDIFNEGVDIPKVNLLLFLRPTDSSTIFIQQLGRGLRKVQGKEYVTVLDFIGNYQNSFMVPLALAGESGNKDLDKTRMKRAVSSEFGDLPGGCYVELDEVAKEQIISKLDTIRLDKADYLKNLYLQFKKDLGCSPEILDFFTAESAPNPTYFFAKFGSLYETKIKCGDAEGNPQALQDNSYLQEVAERLEAMCPLKWPYEFALLLVAIEQDAPSVTQQDVERFLSDYFCLDIDSAQHRPLILSAMKELSLRYKKMVWTFGQHNDDTFQTDADFLTLIQSSSQAKAYIHDRLSYGMKLFRRQFKPTVFLGKGERFVRYQNYTRNDIQFLSEDTAKKGTWREGVKRIGQDYFLFINLNKDEDTEEQLHYKDYFMDPRTFHWQSQNQTSHSSNVGQNYVNHKTRNYRIHLFVRKMVSQYNITLPFMYLGEADYVSSYGDNPMSIVWKLHHAVPVDIYEDMTE